VIDLHSHILPGVDDGARSLAESVAIARAAVEDGIEAIAATPHVRSDYPTEPETMERLVRELRDELARLEVPLDVRPGGEIALDRLPSLGPDELRRFGLGGSARYLLVEFPYYGWPLELGERIFALKMAGITPVIAHPERNGEVQASPRRVEQLVASGALVQLTAASLDGRLGRAPRETGVKLIELGLAHLIASDAHSPAVRGIGMAAAAEAVGDEELARWLTVETPAAIVAGEAPPRRPESAPRRRFKLPFGR
jgi:protein-tyrosine phosphatase